MPLILPESSIKQYHEEGFTLAEGIICNDFIDSLKTILKDWSDKTILEWKEKELILDIEKDLPFEKRLAVLWEKAGRPKYLRSPRRDLICEDLFNILGIKMRSTIQMPQKNMYCRYGYHYKMLPNRIAAYR